MPLKPTRSITPEEGKRTDVHSAVSTPSTHCRIIPLKFPGVPRLCRQAAADFLGADAARLPDLLVAGILSVDPVAGRLRAAGGVCLQRAGRWPARCR